MQRFFYTYNVTTIFCINIQFFSFSDPDSSVWQSDPQLWYFETLTFSCNCLTFVLKVEKSWWQQYCMEASCLKPLFVVWTTTEQNIEYCVQEKSFYIMISIGWPAGCRGTRPSWPSLAPPWVWGMSLVGRLSAGPAGPPSGLSLPQPGWWAGGPPAPYRIKKIYKPMCGW